MIFSESGQLRGLSQCSHIDDHRVKALLKMLEPFRNVNIMIRKKRQRDRLLQHSVRLNHQDFILILTAFCDTVDPSFDNWL